MVVFCTLCYPRGHGTMAAFDLAPMQAGCQTGNYVPVEVRLLEQLTQPRVLAIYLPVRLPAHTVHQTETCSSLRPFLCTVRSLCT